jgi:hypothetical protein
MTFTDKKLKIVSPTPTQPTSPLPTEVVGYGVGPWDLTRSAPILPMDSWELYQAQSYLGRTNVTMEEAKALWKRVDVVSRKEFV